MASPLALYSVLYSRNSSITPKVLNFEPQAFELSCMSEGVCQCDAKVDDPRAVETFHALHELHIYRFVHPDK